MWLFLDVLFHVLHLLLIGLNLFGNLWEKTRKFSYVVQLLTWLSWVGLGLIYGVFGYCPLTDWHWSIKRKLGEVYIPNNYVQYLFDKVLPWQVPPTITDKIIFISFTIACGISLYQIMKSKKRPGNHQA
jgi:hypothetical protein